jgi:anti-sigma factor RsiW
MTEAGRAGLSVDCDEVVELVTDYLEGVLDEAARAEVEAHLALCPGCEEYLRQMRVTIDALGHVPPETLSEGARSALLQAFRERAPSDHGGRTPPSEP